MANLESYIQRRKEERLPYLQKSMDAQRRMRILRERKSAKSDVAEIACEQAYAEMFIKSNQISRFEVFAGGGPWSLRSRRKLP